VSGEARHVQLLAGEGASSRALAELLSRRGHAVLVARDLEEARRQAPPDVCLADIGERGARGLDALEDLRRSGRREPFAVLSAFADWEACRRALRLGALDFLVRPFVPDELLRVVEDDLDRHRTQTLGRWRRSFSALPATIERAAREVAAYGLRCALGPAARARIATACGELVENVVRHAYRGAPGPVHLALTVDDRHLTLAVRDQGVGFDVAALGLEHMQNCADGGLARVSALCEDLRIDSSAAGTHVHAGFDVARVLFEGEEGLDLSELDWLAPETTRSLLGVLARPRHDLPVNLTPAIAVTIGRLLAGPDPQRVLQTALWS